MKKILTLLVFMLFYLNSDSAVKTTWSNSPNNLPESQTLTPKMLEMGLDNFLSLTPKKYREITGKRLGLKKTLELKSAQRILKKKMAKDPDISKGLYVLLAILGFGWLAMGIMDDWNGSDWVVNLILTILCWLPGLIHALVKMKKYY